MRIGTLCALVAIAASILGGPAFGQSTLQLSPPGQPALDLPGASPQSPSPQSPSPTAINVVQRLLELGGVGAPDQLPAPGPTGPNSANARTPSDQSEAVPTTPPNNDVKLSEQDGMISLVMRNGSLRHAVALVAETQGLNLVFAGSSDTAVTASFDRTPWRDVLDTLITTSGHAWMSRGDILIVTSMEDAAQIAPHAEGRQVIVYELDYIRATDVETAVSGLLSPAGSSWITQSMPDDNRASRESIAVVDYAGNHQRIAEYLSQADVPPRQVMLEVQILEVELSEDDKHGVNFQNMASWASANVTAGTTGLMTESASSASPINSTSNPTFFVDINGAGLDAIITAIKQTADTKTLASPRLHALSGQEERIHIGQRLGYNLTGQAINGTTQPNTEFLEVGVTLTVTPRITQDGQVMMRVKPEVSTGAINLLTNAPDEDTTEVETDLLVSDGQGVLIGGLIQETDENRQSKVPWLGDMPYVGGLFQRRETVLRRREIIVSLVPHILPMPAHIQQRYDFDVMRSREPLTQGAICKYPRPYEPSMPDRARHWRRDGEIKLASRQELTRLPPVACSESYEPPVFDEPQRLPEMAPPASFSPSLETPAMFQPSNERATLPSVR
ncbi:Type IV pilus biogenesis and competence protein PilQ precursor [Pseudobythopirellula maris]|uniref:Type IV pilus biogenesis and competence protein PilQ n=1 Tax=Pseudobythopirellula maris TaxID=2527991 RepID=A0A5C5ZNZ7_9BACT|nr:Type IV pilus biogenesis and competence protein PilQ precursor [Pseudobythopirellula maris]